MTIEFSIEEARRLREVLLRQLSELHWEISNTENDELREEMKRDRSFLAEVVTRLGVPAPV